MKNTTGLYIIRDLVSGVPTSAIINSVNDVDALRGFRKFLEKDNIAKEELQLIRIAYIDDQDKIVDSTYYPICTGDKADEMYKTLSTALINGGDLDE